MSSTFGSTYKTTLFGQSHAPAIGCVIEGIPQGFQIDFDKLSSFMKRRAPSNKAGSTSRSEKDEFEIVSGLNSDGLCCGANLCALIYNKDQRTKDYDALLNTPRPSHADFSAWHKYNGLQDMRGGGMFSGRLTAPICISGGIAKQILEKQGIQIAAHILQIGEFKDEEFCAYRMLKEDKDKLNSQIEALRTADFPTISPIVSAFMQNYIEEIHAEGDSLGAIIECVATQVKPGIGNPRFEGLDAKLAQAALSIPSIKAIEIGKGFEVANLLGSQNNDPFMLDGDTITLKTNNAGGIVAGITTGAPVVFKVAVKPTPSIAKPQITYNLETKEQVELSIKGRHDSCIAPRVTPVIEAICAICILDEMLSN